MKRFSFAVSSTVALCVCAISSTGWTQSPTQDPLDVALRYNVKEAKESGHPDFVLPSIDDPSQSIQLSQFRGKKVLLLHFASW